MRITLQSRRLFAAVVLLCASALTVTAHARPSFDLVLKACNNKTIVMGRDENGKLVKAGEDIDGYCKGFLEGVLALLVRAHTVCVKDKNTEPAFLLSVVLTYRAETNLKGGNAAATIEAAFKRAYSCENGAPK